MTWKITLDIMLLGLLSALMVYAFILNRHFQSLKGGHNSLKKTTEDVHHSMIRAHESMEQLKKAAREGQEILTKKLKECHNVCEELEFLVGRSEAVITDMEKLTTTVLKKKVPVEPSIDLRVEKIRSHQKQPIESAGEHEHYQFSESVRKLR